MPIQTLRYPRVGVPPYGFISEPRHGLRNRRFRQGRPHQGHTGRIELCPMGEVRGKHAEQLTVGRGGMPQLAPAEADLMIDPHEQG
jgi:hypothetical protein